MYQLDIEQSSKKITIADIASDLGISKTTVSRAISGKGRISKETVQKVLTYIEEHNYKPNMIAKGLANSKTYNIGVAFPADANLIETPFFQSCLLGICEIAAALDYDVVVTTVTETEINLLKRLVENHKVDGMILTRNLTNDISASYLKEVGIPVVLIGSSDDEDMIQVDNNHMEACEKLTSLLIAEGIKSFALISGNKSHMVNRNRCKGFFNAIEKHGLHQELVFMDASSPVFIEQAVRQAMNKKVDCILCTDDVICSRVLLKLNEGGYNVPDDVKVASFYDSVYLESHNPPVTSIGINVKELGTVAGKKLINVIQGHSEEEKTLVDYEIHLRRSTK